MPTSPKWTMQGRYPEKKTKEGLQGPIPYDVTEKKTGPAYSLSSRPKEKLEAEGPGPGKYNPASQAWSPVKYSFAGGKRSSLRKGGRSLSPGPGQYQAKPSFNTMYGTFSRNKRDLPSKTGEVPGPGMYSSVHDSIQQRVRRGGPVFGKSVQRDKLMKSFSPGPGSYKPKGSVGNEGPS